MTTTLTSIETATCLHFDTAPEELRAPGRRAHVVRARQLVWFLAYEMLHLTYSRIGELYQRDRSTIIHGVEQVRRRGDTSIALEIMARAQGAPKKR